VFLIEHDGRHASNALLSPKMFGPAQVIGKTLIVERGGGIATVQPDFGSNIDQSGFRLL
jgi:hypothetical protein